MDEKMHTIFNATNFGFSFVYKGSNQWLKPLLILMTVGKKPYESMLAKGVMLLTSIFSFSGNVVYGIQEELHYLNHTDIVVCKCFEFGQG